MQHLWKEIRTEIGTEGASNKNGSCFQEKKVSQCNKCAMAFENNTSLYEHLTTVHKEKSLVKCPDCDYFSHRKKYMRTRHKARHVREKMQKILENKST